MSDDPDSPAYVPRVPASEPAAIKAALEEHGVCVVQRAASAEEVAAALDLFWKWLRASSSTGFKDEREFPGGAFDNSNWRTLGYDSGVVACDSIGQSDFLWHCRTLPGVAGLFRSLWGTEDVITSFDGCGVARNPFVPHTMPHVARPKSERVGVKSADTGAEAAAGAGDDGASPARDAAGAAASTVAAAAAARAAEDDPALDTTPGVTTASVVATTTSAAGAAAPSAGAPTHYVNHDFLTRGGWFHLDQNGHQLPRFDLWQGLLNLLPSNAHSGSTVVVPRSHRDTFTRIFRNKTHAPGRCRGNFVKLDKPGDHEYWEGAVQVTMDAGDFFLWDSRIVHCNQGVDASRPSSEVMPGREREALARLVAYICMVPRSRLDEVGQARRVEMVKAGVTGTHQPVVKGKLAVNRRSTSTKYRAPKPKDPRWKLV